MVPDLPRLIRCRRLRPLVKRKASVAELVDAVDLKSIDPRSCRFDPGRRYFVREVIVKGNAYFDFIDGQFLVGEI